MPRFSAHLSTTTSAITKPTVMLRILTDVESSGTSDGQHGRFPPFTSSRVEASNVVEHCGAKTNFYTQLCGLDFLSAGLLWLRFCLREVNRRGFFEVKWTIMENGCKISFHTSLPECNRNEYRTITRGALVSPCFIQR